MDGWIELYKSLFLGNKIIILKSIHNPLLIDIFNGKKSQPVLQFYKSWLRKFWNAARTLSLQQILNRKATKPYIS